MRRVRVAAVAPRALELPPEQDLRTSVDAMIDHWDSWLSHVLCDRPDLIVLPEASDRPANFPLERRLEYYRERGDRIRDHWRDIAREYGCNIAYSAARRLPDGTFRNSTQWIGRDGEILGIYNKNYLVTAEHRDAGILHGKEARALDTDIGRVTCAICFDLNFRELLDRYVPQHPELIVFSSMYHGGLMQAHWAYACRSWFVGSICGDECTVINPLGEVVARSTNYYPYVVADINLDYAVVHIDYHQSKFDAAKRKYGPELRIHDPGHVGAVLLTSESPERTVADIRREFAIETWDDYYRRASAERFAPGAIEP